MPLSSPSAALLPPYSHIILTPCPVCEVHNMSCRWTTPSAHCRMLALALTLSLGQRRVKGESRFCQQRGNYSGSSSPCESGGLGLSRRRFRVGNDPAPEPAGF